GPAVEVLRRIDPETRFGGKDGADPVGEGRVDDEVAVGGPAGRKPGIVAAARAEAVAEDDEGLRRLVLRPAADERQRRLAARKRNVAGGAHRVDVVTGRIATGNHGSTSSVSAALAGAPSTSSRKQLATPPPATG